MLRPQGLLAPWTNRPRPRGPWPPGLLLPGFHAQGSPPGRAGYNYLGTSDNSQDGTLTRWIDAFTGCTSSTVIGRDAPTATPQGRRAREGLPSSHRHHPNVPSPLRRGVLQGCDPGSTPLPWPSPRYPGLGTPWFPPKRVLITTRQASRDATDRWLASP